MAEAWRLSRVARIQEAGRSEPQLHPSRLWDGLAHFYSLSGSPVSLLLGPGIFQGGGCLILPPRGTATPPPGRSQEPLCSQP